MNMADIAIVASNPRMNPEVVYGWDVKVEICVAGEEPLKGEITVKHKPGTRGWFKDVAVVWTSAEIHHFMLTLPQATFVALLRRLDEVAVTRILAL